MKKIHYYKKLIICCGLLVSAMVFSQNENYIYVQEPIESVTAVTTTTKGIKTKQYFDGLGRPKQVVQVQAATTPTGMKDLITHIEYDGYGRQEKEYLPWLSDQTNGNIVTPNALKDATIIYYREKYPCPDGSQCNTNPYSQKEFENSPLNRVKVQAAPGFDWQLDSGRGIKFNYQTNTTTDQVLVFFVADNGDLGKKKDMDGDGSLEAYYLNGRLYKTITTDENWHKIEEFKNKQGQVVLKRTFVSNGEVAWSRGLPPGYEQIVRVDTYYVYDIYGNLAYVIPPLLSDLYKGTGGLPSDWLDKMNDLGYIYKYDNQNRLIEKKLPGKGWEYMVYDKKNRLVATQDATMRIGDKNIWLYTKYDKFDRVVYTGHFGAQKYNREQLQSIVNNYSDGLHKNNEERTSSQTHFGYTNQAFPEIANPQYEIYTVNFYDDYDNIDFHGVSKPVKSVDEQHIRTGDGSTPNNSLKGLNVASFVKILDTSDWEYNYMFYNTRSMMAESRKVNHLGGMYVLRHILDFKGKLIATQTQHKRLASDIDTLYITDWFTYDPQNRLKTHTHQINSLPTERIAANTYNELGQLKYKLVGGPNNLPALQKVDYSYNIRGWLTGINDITDDLELRGLPDEPLDDIFAFQIQYNHLIYGGEVAALPLYNGNISQTFWKSASDNKIRGYSYEYDQMNRLRFAHFNRLNSAGTTAFYPGAFDESMAYDLNGNILHLIRNSEDANGNELEMDNLTYTYQNGNKHSNRLIKVVDAVSSTSNGGFSNGSSGTSDDYTYDVNGNMTSDLNKGITNITYNHLNLPTEIYWSSTKKINYLYNAAGQKVKKIVTNGTNITTTDYLDGFQYLNGVLLFFPHAEGYVKNTVVSGQNTYDYVYNYTDHLGNIRVSYAIDPLTGELDILEENHYYPFGLKHRPYAGKQNIETFNQDTEKGIMLVDNNNDLQQMSLYKYKYNGKELQDELGLNLYDYGARNYDPALGRWMNVDPLADSYYSHSPYNYTLNNPVFFIDPNGMNVDWYQDEGGDYIYDESITSQQDLTDAGIEGTYLGESYSFNVTDNGSGDQLGTVNLNEDGSANFTSTDGGIVEFSNMTVDLGFSSGNKIMAGDYQNGDMFSKGSFIAGAAATGLEHTRGSFRFGTTTQGFSPKYYANSWSGNQYARTFNIGKMGKALGVAGFVLGVAVDGYGVYQYYNNPSSSSAVHPAKAGLNTVMGALGFTGWGTPASILYGAAEAFHPQGAEGALKDMGEIQKTHREQNGGAGFKPRQ